MFTDTWRVLCIYCTQKQHDFTACYTRTSGWQWGGGAEPHGRRKVRLIESNEKYRHQKNWPVMGLWGRCLSVWGPPPLLGYCLGVVLQFCRFWIWSDKECKILQNRVSNKQDSTPRIPSQPLTVCIYQCCGSGSESGSTCFWASWIRIRILLSLSKTSKKNLDFYCFVTSFWLFLLEKCCKCTFKK